MYTITILAFSPSHFSPETKTKYTKTKTITQIKIKIPVHTVALRYILMLDYTLIYRYLNENEYTV